MIDALVKAGADVNAAQPNGETVLMTTARRGKPEALKVLVQHGAHVDAREGQWAHVIHLEFNCSPACRSARCLSPCG